MKTKTKVRSGGVQLQHNVRKVVVKSRVRAGVYGDNLNHNARRSRQWRSSAS